MPYACVHLIPWKPVEGHLWPKRRRFLPFASYEYAVETDHSRCLSSFLSVPHFLPSVVLWTFSFVWWIFGVCWVVSNNSKIAIFPFSAFLTLCLFHSNRRGIYPKLFSIISIHLSGHFSLLLWTKIPGWITSDLNRSPTITITAWLTIEWKYVAK